MNALRKTLLIEDEPLVAMKVTRAPARKLYVVTSKATAETRAAEPAGNALKNIVLFFFAPFIGLVYIIALPVVGLAAVAVLAVRAAAKYAVVRTTAAALKHGAMIAAAPLLGLAYVVFFPVIGLGALAWIGGRAVMGAGGADLR